MTIYRGARLLGTTLNADIEETGQNPLTRTDLLALLKPRLIQTTNYIPDKNALMNVSVLSGQLCIYVQIRIHHLFTSKSTF